MKRRRLWAWYHTFWCLTKYVGMRDRLRCPKCKKVGTWKPHGGIEQPGTPRRWLCKWCGYYEQKDWFGEHCTISNEEGCWVTPDIPSGITTPQRAMTTTMIPKANPWAG